MSINTILGEGKAPYAVDEYFDISTPAGVNRVLSSLQVPTRQKDNLRVPYGAIMVIGPSGSGKSTILRSLKAMLKEGMTIIHAGEPEPYSLPTYEGMLFAAITHAINTTDVCYIDSMANFLTMITGNATTAGLSRNMAGWLASLNGALIRHKKTIFMNVNPLSQRENANAEFLEILQASTSMVIHTDSTSKDYVRCHITPRYGSDRSSQDVSIAIHQDAQYTVDNNRIHKPTYMR
jgi:energy-coupling factor transporter ATP-binding protein EcfA2